MWLTQRRPTSTYPFAMAGRATKRRKYDPPPGVYQISCALRDLNLDSGHSHIVKVGVIAASGLSHIRFIVETGRIVELGASHSYSFFVGDTKVNLSTASCEQCNEEILRIRSLDGSPGPNTARLRSCVQHESISD